jgi:hypothetical protein
MENKGQTEIQEFIEAHKQFCVSFDDWVESLKVLKAAQEKKMKADKDVKTFKEFIDYFKDRTYNRDNVETYLKYVYDAVFRNQRQRMLDLGAAKSGKFSESTNLCFGKSGFATRYAASGYKGSHSNPLSYSEFINIIRQPEELQQVILLLQQAKLYEVAMNVTQFAKLIEKELTMGDGIIVKIDTPIYVPREFGSHGDRMKKPLLSSVIELEDVNTDNNQISFNLICERHEDLKNIDAFFDSSYRDADVRHEVSINLNDKAVSPDELQIWMHLPSIFASIKPAVDEYSTKFAALKDAVEKQFGKYMMAKMVAEK